MTTGCAIGYSILFLIVLFGIGLVVGMCWIERSFICSRCFPSRDNNESRTYVWVMENIRPYFKSPDYENYTSIFIEKNKDKKEQPKIFLKWVFSNIHNVIKLK